MRTRAPSGGAGCTFSAIDEFRNIDANYNALNVSLTEQVGNTPAGNIYFTFAYTYGHSIDDASGFQQRSNQVPSYDPERYRASGDTDIRNRITFSGAWELPFDRMWQSGPKRLTQGWTLFPILTWRTGFPLNVPANLLLGDFSEGPSGAGDAIIVNANVVGPTNILNPRNVQDFGNGPGLYWFNPNSFSNVISADTAGDCSELATRSRPALFRLTHRLWIASSSCTYGSFRRNSLPGPGLVNLISRLQRQPRSPSVWKLEIRGIPSFNILNH